jgi:hypothetical protein
MIILWVGLRAAEYKFAVNEKLSIVQIEDFNFPFSTSAENFYININLLPSGFEILNNKMLRMNILAFTVIAILLATSLAWPCPYTNYRGNVFSGKCEVI